MIAEALMKAAFPVVTVDPGPFTAIMGKRLLPPAPKAYCGKILCAIGSVNARFPCFPGHRPDFGE